MGYLVLVRHGESRWNLVNKFTGWVDVPLSERGIRQAVTSASHLRGLNLDIAFTSKLERAQATLLLILSRQNRTGIFLHESGKEKTWSLHPDMFEREEIPIFTSSALNERYYGKLQGVNKDDMRKKYGEEQVQIWRRSYDVRPPGGESLKDTCHRAVPYFLKHIMPHIRQGKNVIVSAHGNSLRGIIKHIDNISDRDIPHLELPMGKPLIYRYHDGMLIRDNHKHSFDRPLRWHPR